VKDGVWRNSLGVAVSGSALLVLVGVRLPPVTVQLVTVKLDYQ
jgi:hypothetical protein